MIPIIYGKIRIVNAYSDTFDGQYKKLKVNTMKSYVVFCWNEMKLRRKIDGRFDKKMR